MSRTAAFDWLKKVAMDLQCSTSTILEPIDVLLRDSLHNLQWDRVLVYAREGVSRESLNLAFSKAIDRGQWATAQELAEISSRAEEIQFFMDDILNSRWHYVTELIKAGVSSECENIAVRGAVKQNLWAFIPELVRQCTYPEQKTFALKMAVLFDQWECVLDLVRLGLSDEQKELVCQRALSTRQWECLLELLHQGVGKSCMKDIVGLAFDWNVWSLIIDLFKEETVIEGLKVITLKTATAHRQWEAFCRIVDLKGITDCELGDVMITTLNDVDENLTFFHNIITCIQKGRRVFKQLCFKEVVFDSVTLSLIDKLFLKDEADLSIHLAAAAGFWDKVVELFEDSRLRTRTKSHVFRRAVGQHAWKHVTQMSCKKCLRRSDHRFAFFEAVRCKMFGWAFKLYKKHVIMDADVAKALISSDFMWNTDQDWKLILKLCKLCKDKGVGCMLLVHCIKEAFKVSNSFFPFTDDFLTVEFFKNAFKMATKWNCNISVLISSDDHIERHSDVWAKIVCEKSFLRKHHNWKWCVPILEKIIECCYYDLHTIAVYLEKLNPKLVMSLTEWCIKHSFGKVALFISAAREDWNSLTTLCKEHQWSIDRIFICVFERAVMNEQWDAAVTILQHTSTEVVDTYDDGFELIEFYSNLSPLFEKLKQAEMHDWRMTLAVKLCNLNVMEEEIDHCHDCHKVSKDTIELAAECDAWRLVSKLLDRCSESYQDYSTILEHAVMSGDAECTEKILERVNPLRMQNGNILRMAVYADDNREKMVRLCIAAGVSTHHVYIQDGSDMWTMSWSPLKSVLYNGQLPLVELLYGSGACTNNELYSLKSDSELRARLKEQRRQDILQYLDVVATTPRTLQDLSRLTVSHLIGCHPGHCERVLSLSVPNIIKNFILFHDILNRGLS